MASKGKITEIVDVQACEKQLTELNNGLKIVLGTIEQVSKQALTMSNTFKEAKGIKDITTSTQKLNKVEQDKLIAGEKLKQQIIATEKATLALNTAKQKQAEKTQKEIGEYQKLSKELNTAREKAKNLAAQYGVNDKRAREAADGVKKLDSRIKEIDISLGQHQRNVGNYRDAWTGINKVFGVAMGLFAAGGITMKAFNTVIEATDTLADKFAITLGGWKSGFAEIARSIANMNFEDFGKRLASAIKEGHEYAAAQDEIGDRQLALMARESELEKTISQAKVDALLGGKEGLKAIQDGIKASEDLMAVRVELAKFVMETELKNTRQITGATDEQIMKYVLLDETLMKQLETGKKYLELQKQLQSQINASKGTISNTGVLIPGTDTKSQQAATRAEIAALGNDAAMYAKLVTDLGNITDEKRKIIVDAYQGINQAQASSNQETLRLRSREVTEEKALTTNLKGELSERAKAREAYLKDERAFYDESGDYLKKYADAYIKPDAAKGDDPFMAQIEAKISQMEFLQDKKEYNDQLEIEQAEAKRDKLIEIGQQTFDGIMSIVNVQYANQLAQIDQLAKADEEAKQKELKAAGDNANAKNAIEAKYLAKEKEREAERIKIKMKQDKANKAAAMIKVIIDTALGIVSALSTVATAFMAPIIAAQGAIQLGVIAATPLPKYFKGREGGPAEFAMVGERGREAIQLAGGETFLTPDKPTVTWLPEHAKVITNEKLMQAAELAAFKGLPQQGETKTTNDIQIERLIDAINNKKEYHINLTEKGLQMAAKRGNTITEYLNRNVRI